MLERSVDTTALALGDDGAAYLGLMTPLVADGQRIVDAVLSPLSPAAGAGRCRRSPGSGSSAISPADRFARRRFATDEAQAPAWPGCRPTRCCRSAHRARPASAWCWACWATSSGWPMAKGGSQAIADALVSLLLADGGEVVVGHPGAHAGRRPAGRVDPARPLAPPGARPRRRPPAGSLPAPAQPVPLRRRGVEGRLGPRRPDPVDRPRLRPGRHRARLRHRGRGGRGRARRAARAAIPSGPMVLLAQQSLFDPTRAPAGEQNAWGYCHVPNGSTVDMTDRIEAQIERFAPGFRDRILARHVMGPAAIERHDANYVGGDISSGRVDLRQLVTRPVAVALAVAHAGRRPLPLRRLDPAGPRRPRHGRLARGPGRPRRLRRLTRRRADAPVSADRGRAGEAATAGSPRPRWPGAGWRGRGPGRPGGGPGAGGAGPTGGRSRPRWRRAAARVSGEPPPPTLVVASSCSVAISWWILSRTS